MEGSYQGHHGNDLVSEDGIAVETITDPELLSILLLLDDWDLIGYLIEEDTDHE